MTTMHNYSTIAAIVGEEKINALREAGVKIGDKPTKPTTGLFGRWAKHPAFGDVVITVDEVDGNGCVWFAFREHGRRGQITSESRIEMLTFPEETTRPEDVPVGEAWLVEQLGEGEQRAFKTDKDEWQTSSSNPHAVYNIPDDHITLVAPLVPARPEPQSEHPRRLSSLEDYESAPAGTLVAKPGGWACTKTFDGDWYRVKTWLTDREMADTERQVLRWG